MRVRRRSLKSPQKPICQIRRYSVRLSLHWIKQELRSMPLFIRCVIHLLHIYWALALILGQFNYCWDIEAYKPLWFIPMWFKQLNWWRVHLIGFKGNFGQVWFVMNFCSWPNYSERFIEFVWPLCPPNSPYRVLFD